MRDLSAMTSKKCRKKEKCSKAHLLYYVKKVKKGLDNNPQFELKIAQFYGFQRKQKIKITLIKGPKSRKNTR